jgi:hypothetical protein
MKNYRDDWFKIIIGIWNFWTHFQPAWAIKKYRLEEDSIERSDVIFNTCDKIVRDKDKSEWAKKAILSCFIPLVTGWRWPIWMIDKHADAPNHILWRLSKLAYWLKILKWEFYRPRNSMTRDPYYAFWAAAAMHGDWRKIELTPIPLGHFRPNGYFLWKYLVTGEAKYLRWYRFFNGSGSAKKEFVNRLDELRATAIIYKINDSV